MSDVALLAIAALAIVGCNPIAGALISAAEGRSGTGRIVGLVEDARFVVRPETLLVVNRRGLVRTTTGGGDEVVVRPGVTEGKLAPDGERLLVRVGDALSILDARTEIATSLRCCTETFGSFGWAETGDAVWVEAPIVGALANMIPPTRRAIPVGPPRPARAVPACRTQHEITTSSAGCGGLDEGERALVRITGCEIGHWGAPPAMFVGLSSTCEEAVFEYGGAVYVIELASRRVARLVTGAVVARLPAR